MEGRNDRRPVDRLRDRADRVEIRGRGAVVFMVLLCLFFVGAVIVQLVKLCSYDPMLLLTGIGVGAMILIVYYYRFLKQ